MKRLLGKLVVRKDYFVSVGEQIFNIPPKARVTVVRPGMLVISEHEDYCILCGAYARDLPPYRRRYVCQSCRKALYKTIDPKGGKQSAEKRSSVKR